MKRITIPSIILLIIFIGFYLFLFSGKSNGFNRKWQKVGVTIDASRMFLNNIFFAWRPQTEIWLNKRNQPLELLHLDIRLKEIQSHLLELPKGFNANLHNYYFNELASGLLVANEAGGLAWLGKPDPQNYWIPQLLFNDPVTLSRNSVVVRSFKHKIKDSSTELVKINLMKNARISAHYTVKKQVDGIFCSDGQLQYDLNSHSIYYMFYHRGGFLCLDTNLKLLYQAKTVDTVIRANIKFAIDTKLDKKGKAVSAQTLSTPGNLVNKYYSIYQEKIYILSGIQSDNQSTHDFFSKSTIDVYQVKNGTYLYSFMIPKYKDLLLRQFHIVGNRILAIYDKNLVIYIFKPNSTVDLQDHAP